jgi:chaperonin GroEL
MAGSGKVLHFGDGARQELRTGITALSRAVKVTMGPRGRNVVLNRGGGGGTFTKDGVTVAREIELRDHFTNIGAQLLKQAAEKTNDLAGDGTTTAVLLGQAIFDEGVRNIAAGADPMALRRGLDRAMKIVTKELAALSVPVERPETVTQVATIAANGDATIGTLLAEVLDKVGRDGVISIEEGKTVDFETEVVEGLDLQNGWLSPHFNTDTDRLECIIEKPHILITDLKISSLKQLVPFLERFLQASKDLVIICETMENEVLSTLILNKMRGNLHPLVVRAPAFGDRRREILEDIATLTGGTVIAGGMGQTLEDVGLEALGRADRVVSGPRSTTIVGGHGSEQAIRDRIEHMRGQLELNTDSYEREAIQKRLAAVAGGVGIIRIGGSSEVDIREKKYRVEDALNAMRAALEEGVVPGGGVAFLRARTALEPLMAELGRSDEGTAIRILHTALASPLRQIVENAGGQGDVIVRDVEAASGNTGYDAAGERFGDMMELGIIDPVKVSRVALENAVSAAAMMLTTESLIADPPVDDAEAEAAEAAMAAAAMGGGGMPGMGGGMPGMGGGMPGMGGGMPGMGGGMPGMPGGMPGM